MTVSRLRLRREFAGVRVGAGSVLSVTPHRCRISPCGLRQQLGTPNCAVPRVRTLQEVDAVRIARKGQLERVIGVIAFAVTVDQSLWCPLDLKASSPQQGGALDGTACGNERPRPNHPKHSRTHIADGDSDD